jgi:hypothetical protein
VSNKAWWDADHPPRHYALALLEMQGEPDRQKKFMETHVPKNEDFRDMVRDHYKTAVALGGNSSEQG